MKTNLAYWNLQQPVECEEYGEKVNCNIHCWSDVVRDQAETKLSWYQYSQRIQLLNRVGEKDKWLEKRMPTISLLVGFDSYGSVHPCNLQNQVMTATLVCSQSLLLHVLSKRLLWWTWSGRDQIVAFCDMASMYSSAVPTAAGIIWSRCNHMHLLLEWRTVTQILCLFVRQYSIISVHIKIESVCWFMLVIIIVIAKTNVLQNDTFMAYLNGV